MTVSHFVSAMPAIMALALVVAGFEFVRIQNQRERWRRRAIAAEEALMTMIQLTDDGRHALADDVMRNWKRRYLAGEL